MNRIRIRIKAYNRPRQLCNLLADIAEQMRGVDVAFDIIVFDDHSDLDLGEAREMATVMGASWHRAAENYGKQRAWCWTNEIFKSLRPMRDGDIAIFLDDDMRLCDRFFGRVLRLWSRIKDKRKATLHLMVDEQRDDASCWTGFKPKKLDHRIRRTQWVDGSYVCDRRALEAIHYALEPIDPKRWKRHPNRSTGVGQQLSHRLHRLDMHMYQVYESLLVHVADESFYNPTERRKNPLRTVRFVDGAQKHRRLMRTEPIETSLASIPPRRKQLRRVAELLRPQVDVLRVYLNGYERVPQFLERDRIVAVKSQDTAEGDLGDAGKFYWCERAAGYQLICDDDIHYPDDYADRMVAALERYHLRAVVGVHAVTFKDVEAAEVRSYYKARNTRHFSLAQKRDEVVHLLGTGTLAYHPSTLQVRLSDFTERNMADIFVGLLAQAQEVPMVSVERRIKWLQVIPSQDKSIYERATAKPRGDEVQTRIVRAAWPWQLHPTRVRPRHHERCHAKGDPKKCRCRHWDRAARRQADMGPTRIRRYVKGMKK